MDTKLSIDTISEISKHEASPVTSSSPRTAFEQQLCTHLLNLSEVAETLADRVMALEGRLAEVEMAAGARHLHLGFASFAVFPIREEIKLLRTREQVA